MKHFQVAKNTFYQAFARIITSFVGFLIAVIIARSFGVIGFGDFIKVTSYVALFYLIVDFGLNAIFLQEKKARFKDLFYLRLIISLLTFIILNLISFLIPAGKEFGDGFSDSVKLGILLFSTTVFLQSIIFSSTAVFQKQLNYLKYAFGIILGALINLMLIFIISFLNFSLFYIFLSFVFSNIITALVLLNLTKEKILPIVLDRAFAKEILIKAFPLGLMLVFNLIYFRIDTILLSLLAQTKDVGIYGLSYKFFDFLIALPLFLSNSIYPLLIREKHNANIFRLTKKYFFVFLAFSLVVMIPFWFISPLFSLINLEFSGSIIPFRILLFSLPLFFTTSLFQWVLITLGKQKFLMYTYLFAAILNILLNLVYIPKYSYLASATITFISEMLIFTLLLLKTLSIKKLHEKG